MTALYVLYELTAGLLVVAGGYTAHQIRTRTGARND